MQSSKERNFYGQMKRFIEFDLLRGVLLLMMSVDLIVCIDPAKTQFQNTDNENH